MAIKNRLSIRLARSIGRSILKTDIHPIIYIALLLVSLVHTLLCFTPVTAKIFTLFKWFHIGLYIDPLIFTSVLLVPNVIVAVAIVIQIVWAFTEQEIQTTVIKHYIIKGSISLGYAVSLALTLPVIHSSVTLISSTEAAWKIIGTINLLLFILIVYPYTMFLLTDTSPQNNKLFAYVDFPNCFTIYNIYRPIGSLLVATNNHEYSIIPTVMLFCILFFFIIKSPIITWRYNRFSIGFICCLLWLVICRFFHEENLKATTIVVFYLFGTPVFIISSYYLLKKRMTQILKGRKNTVLKLKTLYLILYNMESYSEEIDNFFMNHYRQCCFEKCCCHQILSQVQSQKIAHENHEKALNKANKGTKRASAKLKGRFNLRKALGFSSGKNGDQQKKQSDHLAEEEEVRNQYNKLKSNENVFWFQLLYEMQTENFMIDKLKQLPVIQRDIEFKKAKLLILDQAEVLHYHLEKQYQSLRNLWFFDQLSETNYVSLFSEVRFCIEQQKQQQTIKLKSSQQGSNQYALNYFDFQTKLLSFRSLLLKTVMKCENFWKELSSKQPDQRKITTSIREIYSSHKKVLKQIKKYTIQQKGKSKNNNQYEQNWELKVKKIIQNVYSPFQLAMQLTEVDKENEELLLTDSAKQHKVFEKNLIFYDSNAKTGMGVVNIQQGENFGSISATNKQFWEMLNCSRYEKVKINHFLVKEMHEYHNKIMINFLNHNKHFLNFHGGYACDGNKLLVRIQFSVQLLPHISEGLQAAVFLQVYDTPKGLFLTDQASNILAYNKKFQDQFLQLRSVQDFDEIISRQIIEKLEVNKKHVINLDGEDYLIQFCHVVETKRAESEKLYFCEIAQVWEDIPINVPFTEDEARQSICQKSIEDKNEKSLAATTKKKAKQKKESLQDFLIGLKSQEKSSKVLKWKLCMTILIGLLFMLAVLCAILSEVKKNVYHRTDRRTEYITQMFQDIVQGPYLCRKLNIMVFNNQTENIESIIASVERVQEEITEYKNILSLGLWPQSNLEGIEITEYGQQTVDYTTFEMVLQKYLLSGYTTMLINLEQVNYDYIQDNVPFPYPLQWTNFYSIIFNTHYSVLWNIEAKYKAYIDNQDAFNVLTLWVSPIFHLSLILILISLIVQITSFVLKLRVVNTLWLSLKLLERISMARIEERVQSLKVYREKFLEDLLQNKSRMVDSGQKAKMITINKQSNAADDYPSISMDMMETTSRQFQQTTREKEALADQPRKTNRLKIKQFGKSKIFLKKAAGVFPIIVLSISLIVIQLSFDQLMADSIILKYFYQLKIEGIQKIKAMTYEFGYEDDDLKTKEFSITSNMIGALEMTYIMNRELENLQNKAKPELGRYYSDLGSTNLCKIFVQIGYNLCTQEQQIMFLDKSWNEAVIDYIETARYVHQQYSGLGNSQDKIREYSNSEYHNKFLVYSIRLKQLQNYMLTMLNVEINDRIKVYEIVVIVVSVTMMIYLVFVKFYWLLKAELKMNCEVSEIKTILQLISKKEINNDSQIKEELINKMYYFDVFV